MLIYVMALCHPCNPHLRSRDVSGRVSVVLPLHVLRTQSPHMASACFLLWGLLPATKAVPIVPVNNPSVHLTGLLTACHKMITFFTSPCVQGGVIGFLLVDHHHHHHHTIWGPTGWNVMSLSASTSRDGACVIHHVPPRSSAGSE